MKYIINSQKTKCKKLFDKVIKELNNKFYPEFYPECSICFEATCHKTPICNHVVCLSCESKINKCPICRKEFIKPVPIDLSLYDLVENIIIYNGNEDTITSESSEFYWLFEFR